MKIRRPVVLTIFLIAIACSISEVGFRLAGIIDFPLYEIRSDVGFIPIPNQRGSFLITHDWAFNELSMGINQPYNSSLRPATLLIGDSVVQGGNPLGQKDRLGSQLERISCSHIWPISAGGWAFLNELHYLRSHQELLSNLDRIIFVLNSGDFVTERVWDSELDQPTYRPWLASVYFLRKYLLRSTSTQESPPDTDKWKPELAWLVHAFSKPIVIALYPDLLESKNGALGASQLDFMGDQIATVSGAIRIVNIAKDVRSGPSLYRDDIHPNSEGNMILAKILSETIDECK